MHPGMHGSLLIASGGGGPAGQLPAWHSSTKLAHFRFVEDRVQGSAARIIEFAPHLSFHRLIQSILKLEHGLGGSGAWSGTDMEELQGAETAAHKPAGLGQQLLHSKSSMAATNSVGPLPSVCWLTRPAAMTRRRCLPQCDLE